ncbi:MAG: hypothetical protein WBO71_08175 [Thermoanaerobaculia bacterium]
MRQGNRDLSVFLIALTLAIPSSAEKLSDSRTLNRSIALERSGPQRVIVDNVWGSITVEGYEGETVEMTAVETVRARTAERMDQARREVELQVNKQDGEVEFYVDGPFRCHDRTEQGNCWNNWRDRYEVIYDFRVRVPHDTDIELRTVNHGDIEVSGVRGDFVVNNVNGSVELSGLAGSGEATTVNGPVVASFVSNPKKNSHFETINGKIDVSFQPGLSADLEMVARWGELWSEYKVEALPSPPPTKRTEGGRTVIELQRGSRVRVDGGGPTHSFETLNGNIYVRKGTS